jgi:O-antigen/teichoic acid export membrane protein
MIAGLLQRLPFRTMRSWLAYAMLPAIGLATAPILARALGASGRGELAAVLQPMTVAGAIASIGVPTAVAFYIAGGYSARAMQRLGFAIVTLSTAAVMIVLYAYSFVVERSLGISQLLLIVVWLGVIPTSYLSVRRAAWQGMQVYGPIDVERVVSGLARLAAVAGLFIAGVTSSGGYAFGYLLASLVAALVLLKPIRIVRERAFTGGMARAKSPGMARITRYSLLASMGTISNTLNNRLDQALLPAVVSAHDLGLYSVAVTVAEVPLIISTVTSRNVLSEVAAGESTRVIFRTIATGSAGTLAACALIGVAAPVAVPLVFGPGFRGAVGLTWILLVAALFSFVAEVLIAVLVGRGRPGRASVAPGAGAAVTVIGFALGWHTMSAMEASLIALVTQITTGLIALLLVTRLRDLSRLAARDSRFAMLRRIPWRL